MENTNYLLTIHGIQYLDGETETEELVTTAQYAERGGKKLIRYKELVDTEGAGEMTVSNTIKIESGKVTLTKKMEGRTGNMIFERGVRHQSMYANEAATLMIGVYTDMIDEKISADGGVMEIVYSIDFNGGFESDNRILITLKKMEE
ncbi:MAG: DUF1934 domain-containing protein [Clostridia bacterium]|nr:DUF1934 domain-containing protein [Clostridia bacterium]